jgi:hypothetical protein
MSVILPFVEWHAEQMARVDCHSNCSSLSLSYQAGRCSGNDQRLYSGSARIKPRPGYRLFWFSYCPQANTTILPSFRPWPLLKKVCNYILFMTISSRDLCSWRRASNQCICVTGLNSKVVNIMIIICGVLTSIRDRKPDALNDVIHCSQYLERKCWSNNLK